MAILTSHGKDPQVIPEFTLLDFRPRSVVLFVAPFPIHLVHFFVGVHVPVLVLVVLDYNYGYDDN